MGSHISTSVKPHTINIPGSYIIRKNIDGVWKEQYANITNQSSQNHYEYDYGIVGFHEGNCKLEQIRELTSQEKQLEASGQTFKLPQQFYQSVNV